MDRPSRQALAAAAMPLLALAWLLAMLATPAGAHAAAPLPLAITEVDASDHPTVRVGITGGELPGTGDVRALRVTEDGQANTTGNVYVGRLGTRQQARDSVVLLAIDSSLSMRGERIQDAMRAASAILDHLHGGDRIGVMTFGADTRVLLQPTGDLAAARRLLDRAPSLTLGTALYDAVELAPTALAADPAKHRVLILLTDGIDVDSAASLGAAADAIHDSGVELVAIGVGQDDDGATALERLVDRADGSIHSVAAGTSLAPLYDEIGVKLLRSHWIEYNSMRPAGEPVQLTLSAAGQEPTSTLVQAPPAAPAPPLVPGSARPSTATVDAGLLPVPTTGWSPYLLTLPFGLVAAFAFLVAARGRRLGRLRTLVDAPAQQPEPTPRQRPRLGRATSTPAIVTAGAEPGPLTRVAARTPLGRSVGRLFEQVGLDWTLERLAATSTTLAACAGAAAHLAWSSPPLTALAAAVALAALPVALRSIARRRRARFEQQLPDALSAVCSALRTGHGFDQALAAMAEDAPEPAAGEFRRALEEARLGRPIETSLEAVAERWQSREFEFVATTVSIQRQVGGSLAEVLEIVASTLRNRFVFRRKVQALTSMGRMSAWVLVGLPFVIAGGLSLLNTEFLAPLFTTSFGHVLLVGSAISITLGGLLCRRIVSIDA